LPVPDYDRRPCRGNADSSAPLGEHSIILRVRELTQVIMPLADLEPRGQEDRMPVEQSGLGTSARRQKSHAQEGSSGRT